MDRRAFLLATGLAVLVGCGDDPVSQRAPEATASDSEEQTVAYGSDPAQFAELTVPEGEPRGVVVLVHGGFWRPEYGIEYARPLVPSLVEAGWAVWAIEYRRGTGAQDTLDDVAAAIRALPMEADVVAAVGHSAGGHLATWAAGQDLGLTHVISQAGVLDLVAAHDAGLGGGAVEAFLGHPPGPEDAAVNPIRNVPLDVPVWCVHGSADTIVPPAQSEAYVDAAIAAGGTAELVVVEGDHFVVIAPDSEAWATQLAILDGL